METQTSVKAKRLDESAVLVVGGSSGVGLATAVGFVEAGVRRIAIMARDARRGFAAQHKVRTVASDAQVEFVEGDASDAEQAQRSAERARALLGGIDVMVNSTHGSNPAQPLHKIPVGDIARLVLQTVLAPMQMSRIVLPWMQEQRSGVIINVASDSAKTATPGGTVLGASMAAIVMFSRTLAMEAKRHGIRVNVITPALITGTPLFDLSMADEFTAKVFAEAERKTRLGFASPEDVAALIVFLAGPGAAKLTGQAISVNGGMSAA
jgi:NAD(P)-dependent dehydrogenase (short-subunit alcohol dehydrogenase family)